MPISRRDFIKGGAAAATSCLLGKNRLFPQNSDSTEGWNLHGYLTEFIESRNISNKPEFEFPYHRQKFTAPDRLTVMKGDILAYMHQVVPGINKNNENFVCMEEDVNRYLRSISPDRTPGIYYAHLNILTKGKIDLKIGIGSRADNITNPGNEYEIKGVEGAVNVLIPIEFIESDKVFYRLSYKDENGSYKPVSPIRAFTNPRYSNEVNGYLISDTHFCDDQYYRTPWLSSALDGEKFFEFFKNSLKDPRWIRDTDNETWGYIGRIKNTYNLAQALALIARKNLRTDFIVLNGDDIGLWTGRYAYQGLPPEDYAGNSYKLWLRNRRIFGILNPVIPIYQDLGNHDGEDVGNPAREYAKMARKFYWKQPGLTEGGSPDENYFKIQLANGKTVFRILDAVNYCGSENGFVHDRPEYFVPGEEQFNWLNNDLEKSDEEGNEEITFFLSHHVFGGMPRNPNGTEPGCYGRGQLYKKADYERYKNYLNPPIDVDKVWEPKITDLISKHGRRRFRVTGHDHIDSKPKMIGDNYFAFVGGTTNMVDDEPTWWRDERCWIPEYGYRQRFDFLTAPAINRIWTNSDEVYREVICASHTDRGSNLRDIDAQIGDVVWKHMFKNGQIYILQDLTRA